jgi:broad specificity phosphatase PhoE
MAELAVPAEPIRSLIVWRHTKFNNQAELTGEAAEAVVQSGRTRDDYDDWPLIEEGWQQAELLHQELAGFTIDACLCSPPLRTRQTSKVVLRDRSPEVSIE